MAENRETKPTLEELELIRDAMDYERSRMRTIGMLELGEIALMLKNSEAGLIFQTQPTLANWFLGVREAVRTELKMDLPYSELLEAMNTISINYPTPYHAFIHGIREGERYIQGIGEHSLIWRVRSEYLQMLTGIADPVFDGLTTLERSRRYRDTLRGNSG